MSYTHSVSSIYGSDTYKYRGSSTSGFITVEYHSEYGKSLLAKSSLQSEDRIKNMANEFSPEQQEKLIQLISENMGLSLNDTLSFKAEQRFSKELGDQSFGTSVLKFSLYRELKKEYPPDAVTMIKNLPSRIKKLETCFFNVTENQQSKLPGTISSKDLVTRLTQQMGGKRFTAVYSSPVNLEYIRQFNLFLAQPPKPVNSLTEEQLIGATIYLFEGDKCVIKKDKVIACSKGLNLSPTMTLGGVIYYKKAEGQLSDDPCKEQPKMTIPLENNAQIAELLPYLNGVPEV